MSDELYNEQRIRSLMLVDNYTRESLAIEVNQHLGRQQVAEILSLVTLERVRPKKITTPMVVPMVMLVQRLKQLQLQVVGNSWHCGGRI
jgi:hypothetical protein